MKLIGIYKIQSTIHPERYYIGSAMNIDGRWVKHISDLKLHKHHSSKLQNHYDKYGLADLKFSIILHGCHKEDLIFIEQICITPKPFFNNSPTAGSCIGCKHSEESNRKKSIRQKNKTQKHTTKGIQHSKDHTLHASEARKKKIYQYNENTFIKEWTSAKDASNELHISYTHLCACVRGERKHCGGFIWKPPMQL